jgi:hypothetical protein
MTFNGVASLELELNLTMSEEVFLALVESPVTNGVLVSEERHAQVALKEAKVTLASEERDGQVTSQET